MKNVEIIKKIYTKDLTRSYHPEGTDVDAIILHEMGHFVEYSLAAHEAISLKDMLNILKKRKISMKLKKETLKTLKLADDEEIITKVLSRYATLNSSEFMAEAFAEALGSPNPRLVAKTFIELLKEMLIKRGLLK